ncbi:MAG: hypothetical protein NT040_12285 [Bacteroidetes bacterium]|nr:hypothetical protein [Bacteroidota bacterium]
MLGKRFAIRLFCHSNLILFRQILLLFAGLLLFCSSGTGNPFHNEGHGPCIVVQDTVFVRKGRYLLLRNASINIPRDTFYIIHQKKSKKASAGSFQNSQILYDTVYRKFSRNKITQLLYYLAFVAPKKSELPDTLQVVKSTRPFEEFEGKVIRNIRINILPPFGTNVYDTASYVLTGIGKTLNGVHMDTRRYVIRRNLLVKKGDRLNPLLLSDNERLLRNMSAIDNARIIVVLAGQGSDSVDLVVVAKDVWSIGVDVPSITSRQVKFRIYDANFLGLGDKLITNMSLGLYRAPFFMFEGLAYTYSNIGGSLINATFGYISDNTGYQNLFFRADRPFLTNMTKWAGGALTSLETVIDKPPGHKKITLYLNNEGLWLGRAFFLKGQKDASRVVLSAAVYRKNYTSRPIVTIDSNRSYYNQLQVLTAFSFSRNNYYLTDYVLNFGKTENLPYGHLFQITAGPDNSEFYTRIYSGIHISAGNFFEKIGYISAYLKFGGFFNYSSFEDAVVKFNIHYFTPLLKTHDSRYKFRVFYSTDYRRAFNMRSNNPDQYNANLNFNIDRVQNSEDFNTYNLISGKLSSVCFLPVYFYGFRFAVKMDIQTGLFAQKKTPLYNAPLFGSIGLSIIIKNDNLVFPPVSISAFYYSPIRNSYNQFQFYINSDLYMHHDDFNVGAPYEETLTN